MRSNSIPTRAPLAVSAAGRDTAPSGGILFVPAASRERFAVRERLGRLGLPVTTVVNVTDALRLLASRSFALCLVDLADDRLALPSIRVVRAQHPHVPIGAIVDPSNPFVAGEALHLGAVDLLPWPFDGRDVTTLLANVADRQDIAPAVHPLPQSGAESLFAHSAPMRLVVDAVRRAADTTGGVYLCGEPGTGRARVAYAIHAQSSRAGQRFLSIDCAGVGPEELERRLFGLAIERRAQPRGPAVERIGPGGAIYEARGGTLYLSMSSKRPLGFRRAWRGCCATARRTWPTAGTPLTSMCG